MGVPDQRRPVVKSLAMTPRDNFRAALVAIIWGANFVVIDEGLKGFPPFLLLAARFLLVTFPLVFFIPRPGPWRQILLIGTFMSLGQFMLLYIALHLGMSTGLASLLVQVQVIFTIGISRVVLGERPTRQQLLGVGIGLVGLAVLVLGRGAHTPLGPLAITVAACLSWAIGNVLARRSKIKSGLGLTIWSGIVVPIPALALALLVNGSHEIGHAVAHISWLTIFSVLYTVLGASLFGYGSLELAALTLSGQLRGALHADGAGGRDHHSLDRPRAGADARRDPRRHRSAGRRRYRDAPTCSRSPSRE